MIGFAPIGSHWRMRVHARGSADDKLAPCAWRGAEGSSSHPARGHAKSLQTGDFVGLQLFLRSLRLYHYRGKNGGFSVAWVRFRYILRSLVAPRLQLEWLHFLLDDPRRTAFVASNPGLMEHWQRDHYINYKPGLPRRTRFEAARSHYRYICERLPVGLIDEVYRHDRWALLGTVTLKDGADLRIEFRRPLANSREGELNLCLADTAGQIMSSCILTIADEGRTLLVGNLQGADAALAKSSQGREAVRELTKQCHGLRPKNLVLSLLIALAGEIGAERLRCVSNSAHPFVKKKGKIKADYDEFWRENGGVPQADGFFDMPVREPVRDIAQVESKHRSAFRRREQLREEACKVMVACCAARLVLPNQTISEAGA